MDKLTVSQRKYTSVNKSAFIISVPELQAIVQMGIYQSRYMLPVTGDISMARKGIPASFAFPQRTLSHPAFCAFSPSDIRLSPT